MSTLHPVDWIVIAAYFGLIAGIVVWVAKKQKKTTDGYFLAGRELEERTRDHMSRSSSVRLLSRD